VWLCEFFTSDGCAVAAADDLMRGRWPLHFALRFVEARAGDGKILETVLDDFAPAFLPAPSPLRPYRTLPLFEAILILRAF
jgi:hypothetical protein